VIRRYRTILTLPGFTRLLVSSIVGRLPSGMFSLAILLFVHASTGSFLAAGQAVAAFTLAGAVAGPVLGRLADRVGQTRVLLPAAAAQATMLVALVLIGHAEAAALRITAVAAVAGAAQPPLAGCVRALWSQVAVDQQALETAYALDATAQEVIWTLGPLLVGSTALLLSAAAAVLLCAAITLAGTLYFASSKVSRAWQPNTRRRAPGGALANPGLRSLLVTVALAGVVIGAVEVGLPALAAEHGSRWSAGPFLALFSIGSMLGGLAYSARNWRLAIAPRYRLTLAAMTLAVAPLMESHSLTAGFPLSLIAGLALAPMLSAQLSLVGALARPDSTTEAFTWHRTATIAGMAAGSALGGLLIDAHGASAAFGLGCTGVTAAWLMSALRCAHLEPPQTPSQIKTLAN
jgi:predicted MFS family arabinose efflux permease